MFEEESLFTPIESDRDMLSGSSQLFIGKMQPNAIKGTSSDTSECETFIQNINKYDYLFHLCDIRPY